MGVDGKKSNFLDGISVYVRNRRKMEKWTSLFLRTK
jgi:hypothetical protein